MTDQNAQDFFGYWKDFGFYSEWDGILVSLGCHKNFNYRNLVIQF